MNSQIASANSDFSAEASVAFLRSQGRHVVETETCWWYNPYGQTRIFYSFPPNRIVEPTRTEISTVFQKARKAKALRFLSPSTASGHESYLWECTKPYGLETVSSKARNQVRQGLRNCEVRSLSLRELEHLGEKAHSDSLQRFGIEGGQLRFGNQMSNSPAYEAWAAFFEGDLAAYLVTLRVEDWAYIQIHRSVNEYLKYRPNNALIFTVLQELLSRPEISTVSYGWEPLYNLDSLDSFKLAMGSVKRSCKQAVVLKPWLQPAFPPLVCRAVEKLSEFHQSSRRLRQMAGVCRIIRESAK